MEKIKKLLKEYQENNQTNINVNKLNNTINISKDSFYKGKEHRTISYFEFLFEQAKYIQKRWWIIQIILLFALWKIIDSFESEDSIRRCIGILVPTFVIMILPELLKNRLSKSLEIECSTCYSLKEVYSAKMILFAIIDIFLISIFIIMVSTTTKMRLIDLIIQFFIPFNITCSICLTILRCKRSYKDYIESIVAFISIAIWMLIVLQENIYNMITLPIWIGIIMFSILYLCFSIYKIFTENIQELWEEKVWN